MKISFIAFDLSSNGLARIVDIARILDDKYEVEIIGPIFGKQIWLPYENIYKYKQVKGENFPRFFKSIKKMLCMIEGDIIYASNPKTSSYGISLLKKLTEKDKPLIIDISDWHLGYSLHKGALSIFKDTIASLNIPSGFLHNLLMDYSVRFADEITVVSKFLHKKYGGIVLPQFVNTDIYDPQKYNREELRKKQGIHNKKIISFIGTPHPHKGIEEIIHAVKKLDKKNNIKIMMTGNYKDPYVKYLLSLGGNNIIFLGYIPRYQEPIYLSIADLIVLPQRLGYFSMAQIPVKVMTAMAMEKPIIASKVSDLPEILDGCGIVVNPGDINALADSISYLFDNYSIADKLGKKARLKCIKKYSVNSVSSILYNLIEKLNI